MSNQYWSIYNFFISFVSSIQIIFIMIVHNMDDIYWREYPTSEMWKEHE